MVPKIVAAGRGKSVSMPAIRDKIISLTNKAHPTILYLGTASFDRNEPYVAQTKGLRDAGCHITRIDISEANSNQLESSHLHMTMLKKQFAKEFSEADAILASGGDTCHALRRWKQVGIDKFILEAAFRKRNPAVLCGGSAGGICWFSYCHIMQKPYDLLKVSNSIDLKNMNSRIPVKNLELDEERQSLQLEYYRISGMNIVPALCVPHHDVAPSNALPRSEDSNRMTLHYSNIPTIGIDEAAALVLVGNQASVVSGDGKAKCYLKRCIKDKLKGKRLKIIAKHHCDEEFNICDFFQKAKQ